MKHLLRTTSIVTVALLAASGCKKEDKAPAPGEAPASGKATAPAGEQPAAWTGADSARAYLACREAFNANQGEALRKCLAEDATMTLLDFIGPDMKMEGREAIAGMLEGFRAGFPDASSTPQLVLANGDKVAAIVLDSGTNSGEMMGQPPTNKKTSSLAATLTWFNDKGEMVRDVSLADQATMAHQLGLHESKLAPASESPWKETVTTVADPASEEKIGTNVELVKNAFEAMQKKDIDGLMAHVADDVTFRYVPHHQPIEGKDAYRQGIEEYLGMAASSSRKIEDIWGAGDWVVAWSEVENELAADIPGVEGSRGKKTTTHQIEFFRLADGKVTEQWVFENSSKWAVQVGLIDDPAE